MSFLFGEICPNRFEDLNATRRSVAADSWTEANLNFAIGKMQTNLGGTSKKDTTQKGGFFLLRSV